MDVHLNKPFNKNYITGYVDDNFDVYSFNAKYFDEPSQFGINEGRISKLSISTGNQGLIANYDRGWDIRPINEDFEVCNTIINYIEDLPRIK